MNGYNPYRLTAYLLKGSSLAATGGPTSLLM
jgi:hypothetical protein